MISEWKRRRAEANEPPWPDEDRARWLDDIRDVGKALRRRRRKLRRWVMRGGRP